MPDDILSRLGNQPPYTNDKGQVVEDKPNEEPVEEVVEEPEVETSSERTREQFEKLAKSNQELNKEKEEAREEAERLKKELEAKKAEARQFAQHGFDAPVPQNNYWDQMVVNKAPRADEFQGMNQKQVNDVFKSLIDDDGYVNTDLLKEELSKSQQATQMALQAAEQARREAQMSRKSFDDFQRNSVAKSVHSKYPQLDPDSDSFNPDFYDFTKGEMVNQLMRGEQEDFARAADKWASKFVKKEEPVKDTKKANAAKQINATNPKSGPREYQSDHADLIKSVRSGKKGALAERLRRSGY